MRLFRKELPKYRIRAYVDFFTGTGYVKIQQRVWWGWQTVEKEINLIESAVRKVNSLTAAHLATEFTEPSDPTPLVNQKRIVDLDK